MRSTQGFRLAKRCWRFLMLRDPELAPDAVLLPDAATSELAADATLPGLPVLPDAARSEVAPDGDAVLEPITPGEAFGVTPKSPALFAVRSLELLPAEDEDTEPVVAGLVPPEEVLAVVAECAADPPVLAAPTPPLSPLVVRVPAW